mmetsp:Transcript_46528/g.149452  ORF Transcript_46528/g.149452 Transcript_46528/m.149452 type:complete len:782 (-) Transcript_46528:279-2624(-)
MAGDLEAPLLKKAVAPFKVTTSPPPNVKYHPLAWLLWSLDIIIWVLQIVGPVHWILSLCKSSQEGVQQPDGAVRNAAHKDLVDRADPACSTVHEVMQSAFQRYASQNALGTRTYLGAHMPAGAKFPLALFGETVWTTYGEFGAGVKAFGAGLRNLGLEPAPDGVDLQSTTGPHTLLIFEDTSAPWMTAMLGAFTQSIAVATSYSTLGLSSVAEAIQETSARVIVCNIKDVEKVAKFCTSSKCPTLQTIIYTRNNSTETTLKSPPSSHKVMSVDEVLALGTSKPVPFTAPSPDTLAVIMYTSGSTGKPKGVMIRHRNLVAAMAALRLKFLELGLKAGEETYLAYLPAAHILELVAELTNLSLGSAVGFGDPRTISSKGACRQRPDGSINTKGEYPYPPGAIQEFRPTLMAAVPKIWDILKKGVEEVVGKGSPLKKMLFQIAYSGRFWAVSQGRESPLFKKLIFSKLKDMLGGRLKVGLTGGGPISADVQNFISTAFAMPLLQGYALTETCCAGTVQMLADVRNGVVGPPLACVELKLRSCFNDMGEPEILDRMMKPYKADDKSHYGTNCLGRGEVMLRGPSVSSGYFKQVDKTKEVFDTDGWFHSGDVGLFTPDGSLMIVDRVKNLVKLKGGEYIAIEAMEKEYSTSVYVNAVNGGLLCFGDGEMDRPVALIQANLPELEKWATGSGITYGKPEEICALPAAQKLVLDNLVKIGKEGGLCANEILCAIALIPGTGPMAGDLTAASPWTPENGGLTASNKLNRQPIQKGCTQMLDHLREQAIR